jgi:hypothetical protein
MTDARFTPDVIAAAQAADLKWTIFASVSLAQWAVESDYGRAMPRGSNNPFGIKAIGDQPYVAAWTHETIGARYVKIVQRFAKFGGVADAFDAHARLLATSGYYVKARHDQNPRQFAIDLTGIYATGIPGHPYGQVLIGVMDANNLYQFDVAPGVWIAPQPPLAASLIESPLWIQTRLNAAGAKPPLILDGILGDASHAAIYAFQVAHNLTADGIAGPATIAALSA